MWPRGLTKERAALDLWLKEVAPSPELRKWFGHDPARWEQFQKRYWKELEEKEEAVQLLKQKGKEGTVTDAVGSPRPSGDTRSTRRPGGGETATPPMTTAAVMRAARIGDPLHCNGHGGLMPKSNR